LHFASLVSAGSLLFGQSAGAENAEVWMFNQTSAVGGHATQVLAHPQVIETPLGKAVQFSGVADALFVPVHPWQVRKPGRGRSSSGRTRMALRHSDSSTYRCWIRQRERIPMTGCCLRYGLSTGSGDSFAMADGQSKTLLNCEKLHPVGRWYRVTAVYNGKTLSNY
jgi:hypothetical protein